MKTISKLKSLRTLAASLITIGALAGGVNGATMKFGSTQLFPAAPYIEAGLVVTATTSSNGIFPATGGFSSHYFTFDAPSTTASIALDPLGPATSFDLISLDLGVGGNAGAPIADIAFVGTLQGGGTLNANFPGVNSVRNVVLNWTGLTSVTISGTEDPGIDNVNVSLVPEPSAALFLGFGVLGMVGRRQRKK